MQTIMQTITEWTVKRSGPGLVVTGKDESGTDTKITGVTEVTRMTLSEERVVTVAIRAQGEGVILN